MELLQKLTILADAAKYDAACTSSAEPSLFEVRTVTTDSAHAERVSRSLRKLSPDVLPLLRRAYLTCLPDKELAIYRFVAKLYREGASYLNA